MELVYLWIEKYKNIERQGFTFSPRFKCEFKPKYNEKDELIPEESELVIEEKKDYVNIFPDNINVTAIVGKNGAGKSNIIKAIYELIFLYFNKDKKNFYWESDIEDIYTHETIVISLISMTEEKNSFFLILHFENKFYKIDSEEIKNYLQRNDLNVLGLKNNIHFEFNIKSNKNIENFNDIIDSFFIYYNFSIDTWDEKLFQWQEYLYHRKDNYELPLLIEPYKKNKKIDIDLLMHINEQRILLFYSFYKDKLIKYNVTNFFNPNQIRFEYAKAYTPHKDELLYKNAKLLSEAQYNNYKLLIKYINLKNTFLGNEKNKSFFPKDEIKEIIISFYSMKKYKELNLLYILFKMIEKKQYLEKIADRIDYFEQKLKKIKNDYENNFEKLINEFEDFINSNNFDFIYKDYYNLLKLRIAINFHKKLLYSKLPNNVNKIDINKIPKDDIVNFFPGWLEVHFYENEKSLNSLSTGEKYKFLFIIGLLYQLSNINKVDKYKSIYLILDELELGLHPEWQKNFINNLLFSLNSFKEYGKFEKKLNFILLTHSPFILSDIPKENIIFMKNGKNVSDEVEIETFGANIHTLLTHGFFMEDGLMGEYAKKKINDVINYIRAKKDEKKLQTSIKDDKEAEYIINSIGEPFLREKLRKMLYSTIENEEERIKKQIKDLEKKLEKLKSKK